LQSIISIKEKLARYDRRVIHKDSLTKSAVLVPITKTANGLELLFTKRTESVEHHKGQISFPGGAFDPIDRTSSDTALRESFEEIGLMPGRVSLLGTMDDLQTPSGFIVTPVIGYIENLPPLHLNPEEVAQVILIPLENFFDDSLRHSSLMERDGTKVEVFFYDVWNEPIWGATAFFVKKLVDVVRSA
jgi:8-oxo-dGTP pyrophosphatase MutT (NUDIX family)